MKGKNARGSITVFLSLSSVLFLSLIFSVIESARIQGARAQTANITDMGNYSLFGEYEKKLLEDYEIFSVDGSYGTGDFSIDSPAMPVPDRSGWPDCALIPGDYTWNTARLKSMRCCQIRKVRIFISRQ